MWKYICLVWFISLPGCLINDEHSKETGVIRDFIENYYTIMSNRDWSSFRTLFWDNGTITTIWQKPEEDSIAVHIVTIDEFIVQTPQGPDSQPVFEEKLLSANIEVKGNLALVWARFNAIFGTEQDLSEWQGTDVFTMMKHEGTWKIVSLAFEADK